MGVYSIKDCGTAHELQLLELYEAIVETERTRTGKEPTSLDKTNINAEVAEAYQSILSICKDGGSISQALMLLEKRITTSQVSVNEISKVAADVAVEVHTGEFDNIENSEGRDVAELITVTGLASDLAGKYDEIAEINLPNVLGDFDTPEMADKYDKTSELAENGDENAQYAKGLINYALYYLRIADSDIPKGKETMVLILIQNLSKTGDYAALEMATKLAEKYKFDVFSKDENGNAIFDEEKHINIYREKMQKINPKAADRIVDFNETKRDFFIERGKKSPKAYKENLDAVEDKKRKTVFTRKYNELIKTEEVGKAEEYVKINLDIAKEVLNENVIRYGEAQTKGNKTYMTHLQKINDFLSKDVAQASKELKAIDVAKVGVDDVVSSVNLNPKSLIQEDDREL